MSQSRKIWVGTIFAISLLVGAALIGVSQSFLEPTWGGQLGESMLTAGAMIVAATVGVFFAGLDSDGRRDVLAVLAIVLLGLIGLMLVLVLTSRWEPRLLAYLGVVVGVFVAEGLIRLLQWRSN